MLPAHAGVILNKLSCCSLMGNVTRTRGGDPGCAALYSRWLTCYPHTRG